MGIITFFLNNKGLVIAGLLIAALLSAGIYIKILKSDISVLEAAKQVLIAELQVSNASIASLRDAILFQNKAIDEYKSAAAERQKLHQKEITKAQITAAGYKKQAEELLKRTPPQDVPICDAANLLFNEEIKNAIK